MTWEHADVRKRTAAPVVAVEPGCTCGGVAACPQCQDRDAASVDATLTDDERVARVRFLFQPAEEVMPGGALHRYNCEWHEDALAEVERRLAEREAYFDARNVDFSTNDPNHADIWAAAYGTALCIVREVREGVGTDE